MWSFLFGKRKKQNKLAESFSEIPARSYVQVRMEAVGGQGAHSAGKILAEAAVIHHGYTEIIFQVLALKNAELQLDPLSDLPPIIDKFARYPLFKNQNCWLFFMNIFYSHIRKL